MSGTDGSLGVDYSDRISVAVDIVVFRIADDTLKVLLIRRKYPPFQGLWAIPGGFVDLDESLDTAARRELKEETNIGELFYLEQLFTFGEVDRDPRSRVVSVAYFAVLPTETSDARAGDDAAEAQWFPIYDLPQLAFDHKTILTYALTRLRYKLEYADVVFYFLPDTFTLSDIQTAYEIILREELDKRNFRRKVLMTEVVIETGDYRGGEGRPAKLYRLNPDASPEVKARRLYP